MTLVQEIMQNKVLVSAVLAWAAAQILKVFTNYFRHRKMEVERLVGAGGMPSSHSALVVALTMSVGLNFGWDSPLVALSCVLAAIVMYDAAGVRNAAGKQAKVINKLVREHPAPRVAREGKLKELLGHTPVEVVAGAFLGAAMAYFIYWYW